MAQPQRARARFTPRAHARARGLSGFVRDGTAFPGRFLFHRSCSRLLTSRLLNARDMKHEDALKYAGKRVRLIHVGSPIDRPVLGTVTDVHKVMLTIEGDDRDNHLFALSDITTIEPLE